MTKILVLDNYDSFVYTLNGYLQQLGAECTVVRNDEVAASEADKYDGVLISPGPGTPEAAGVSMAMIKHAAEKQKPLLGVCLGHQAIATVFGGGNFATGAAKLTKFMAGQGDWWGSNNDFIKGRVAMVAAADWMSMMFCDPDGWALNPCTKPAVNFGTAPFPVEASILGSNYGSGLVGGQVMGISKGSKNVKDAWIVLKGLATDLTLSIDFANANGSVPVLNAALKSGKITYPAIYQTFYDIAGNSKSGYHTLKNTGEHLEDVEIFNFMSAWQAGSVSDLKSGLKEVASKVSSILSRNY